MISRHQYHLALAVRRAQRRIAVSKLSGLAWYEDTEVDRISRQIAAIVLRGWL